MILTALRTEVELVLGFEAVQVEGEVHLVKSVVRAYGVRGPFSSHYNILS